MLQWLNVDPNFLEKMVTDDETYVYEYDPESKRQSSEWHTASSPKLKKTHMTKSRVKCMLIVFSGKGVIHKEFVPRGQTVTGDFYAGVLSRLRDRVRCVSPAIKGDLILHHDKTPAHTSRAADEILVRFNVTTLSQPAYSPDLAPSDFFLKGKRFDSIDAIQQVSTRALVQGLSQKLRTAEGTLAALC